MVDQLTLADFLSGCAYIDQQLRQQQQVARAQAEGR